MWACWTPPYHLVAESALSVKACSSGRVCSSHTWNRKSGGKRQFAKNKKERCSYSPPRHWMEVLIHLWTFLQQAETITGFAMTLFLKHFFWNAIFCLIKKKINSQTKQPTTFPSWLWYRNMWKPDLPLRRRQKARRVVYLLDCVWNNKS